MCGGADSPGSELEACVLFYEHTRLGVGLGLFRGGDYIGESLVAGPEALRVHYVHLATQALLKEVAYSRREPHHQSSTERCIEIMGPASNFRSFSEARCSTSCRWRALTRACWPAWDRAPGAAWQESANNWKKARTFNLYLCWSRISPWKVMLALEAKSMPQRISKFFHARYRLLRANSDFFSMGLRLPDGPWLSLLSGWRRNGVTYVDLQMNDMHYKKESISAVMRAFMLEHEIARKQQLINFVGGSSLLLRRYCEPIEPCTDFFIWKPGPAANFFEMLATHVQSGSVYERLKSGPGAVPSFPETVGASDQGSMLGRNRQLRSRRKLVGLGEIPLIDPQAQPPARIDIEQGRAHRHIAERLYKGKVVILAAQRNRYGVAERIAQLGKGFAGHVQHQVSERPIDSQHLAMQTGGVDGGRVNFQPHQLGYIDRRTRRGPIVAPRQVRPCRRENIPAVEGRGEGGANHPPGLVISRAATMPSRSATRVSKPLSGRTKNWPTLDCAMIALRVLPTRIDHHHKDSIFGEVGCRTGEKTRALRNIERRHLVGDIDDVHPGSDPLHDRLADAHGVIFDVEVGHETDGAQGRLSGRGRQGRDHQQREEKGKAKQRRLS
jgi:hypothetical protein